MKFKLISCLYFITILIISCSLKSPIDIVKIDQIIVTTSDGNYLFEVELSREVILPIDLNEAIFIIEECFDLSLNSIGDIELINNDWITTLHIGNFYWRIFVNRYTANVILDVL